MMRLLVSVAAASVIAVIGLALTGHIQLHCDKEAGKTDDCYVRIGRKTKAGK